MDGRRDRVGCDDVEVGSLRRTDERSDVRPTKLIYPLRAVDVCPCRTRARPRRSLNPLNPLNSLTPCIALIALQSLDTLAAGIALIAL